MPKTGSIKIILAVFKLINIEMKTFSVSPTFQSASFVLTDLPSTYVHALISDFSVPTACSSLGVIFQNSDHFPTIFAH